MTTHRVDFCYRAYSEHGAMPYAITFDVTDEEFKQAGVEPRYGEYDPEESARLWAVLKHRARFDGDSAAADDLSSNRSGG